MAIIEPIAILIVILELIAILIAILERIAILIVILELIAIIIAIFYCNILQLQYIMSYLWYTPEVGTILLVSIVIRIAVPIILVSIVILLAVPIIIAILELTAIIISILV